MSDFRSVPLLSAGVFEESRVTREEFLDQHDQGYFESPQEHVNPAEVEVLPVSNRLLAHGGDYLRKSYLNIEKRLFPSRTAMSLKAPHPL